MIQTKAFFQKTNHPVLGEITAPLIISASRATDIPAFYSEWLINRFEKGYFAKINPYDRSKITYFSLEKTLAIIFWSKNPNPLINHLEYFDKRNISYYFQFTLNDYEKENLEENVPPLSERMESFIRLSEKIGREKVIWRFDPVIRTDQTTYEEILKRIERIGGKIAPFTNKLVFSFAETASYAKVRRNLAQRKDLFSLNAEKYQAEKDERLKFAEMLSSAVGKFRKINPEFSVAACADAVDYSEFGIERNRCIDDELLLQISNNPELHSFLRPSLFRDDYYLKDRGQRKNCGCVISKDIGAYDTCPHFCLYCYANSSKESVLKKMDYFNKMSEFI